MPHFLVHTARDTRRVVDPGDIYLVESRGHDTRVRLRGSRPLRDVRELGALTPLLQRHGLLRIHRRYLVNPDHVLARCGLSPVCESRVGS